VVILGMEGFATDGSQIVPLMDYITTSFPLQGTWDEQVDSTASTALRIVEAWGEGPEFIDFAVRLPDSGAE
jgi:hypothetical protein